MRGRAIGRIVGLALLFALPLLVSGCESMNGGEPPPQDGVVREGIVEIYRGQGADEELIGAYTTEVDDPSKRLWILVTGETPLLGPDIGETIHFRHESAGEVTESGLCLAYIGKLASWQLWTSQTSVAPSGACEHLAEMIEGEAAMQPLPGIEEVPQKAEQTKPAVLPDDDGE